MERGTGERLPVAQAVAGSTPVIRPAEAGRRRGSNLGACAGNQGEERCLRHRESERHVTPGGRAARRRWALASARVCRPDNVRTF